jgi:hypothetical protein
VVTQILGDMGVDAIKVEMERVTRSEGSARRAIPARAPIF